MKWQNGQPEDPQSREGTAALSRPHRRGPCEVQTARRAGTELSGVRSPQVSGSEGVKSMLKADGGEEEGIKSNLVVPHRGVCALVAVSKAGNPSGEPRGVSQTYRGRCCPHRSSSGDLLLVTSAPSPKTTMKCSVC